MRKIILFLLFAWPLHAAAHDYFLLPNKFFLKKGDSLVCRLFVGDDFVKELEERSVKSYIVKDFEWLQSDLFVQDGTTYETVKHEPLVPDHYDSIPPPAMAKRVTKAGLGLVYMNRGYAHIAFSKEKFTAYLKAEHLEDILKLRQQLPVKDTEREKYTRYIKSLVTIDKPTGTLYNSRLGQTLEIVLLNNPYTVKRGGELSAEVYFRGNPLVNGSLEVLCKDAAGKVFITPMKSDVHGIIHFKLDRAGTWMVRITHMIPSKDADADWESFWASYTFGVQ